MIYPQQVIVVLANRIQLCKPATHPYNPPGSAPEECSMFGIGILELIILAILAAGGIGVVVLILYLTRRKDD
jgi:hypothetical protein